MVCPAKHNTYDAAHIFFSDGICNHELAFMFTRLATAGVRFKHILDDCPIGDWKFPMIWAAGRKVLQDLFSPGRERSMREHLSFGSGPTELLFAIPFVLAYIDLHLSPELRQKFRSEIQSFRAMCDIVGALKRSKVAEADADASAAHLLEALERHARFYRAAYQHEPTAFLSKWHMQWHLPGQIRRDGRLLDTMPAERKHGVIRLAADQVKHTRSFENSVLKRALSITLHDLGELQLGDGLRGAVRHKLFSEMCGLNEEAVFAKQAKMGNTSFHSGDFIALGDGMWCVDGFASTPEEPGPLLIARPCTREAGVSTTVSRWRVDSEPAVFSLSAAPRLAELWRWQDEGHAIVVSY